MLSYVHPDAARDKAKVNQFLLLLRASWDAGVGVADGDRSEAMSAADQLTAVCAALEAAASQATYLPYLRPCMTGRLSFVRSASTDATGDHSGTTSALSPAAGGTGVGAGAGAGGSVELVRLMLTESRAATLATVMTAFSRTGILPEWYNLLLCAPSVANPNGGGGGRESVDAAKAAMAACWEPVANLIRRWSGTDINTDDGLSDGASAGDVGGGGASTGANPGVGGIFVLAFVDELPIDVQQRTLDLIRQHAPFAKVPLLLVGRDPSGTRTNATRPPPHYRNLSRSSRTKQYCVGLLRVPGSCSKYPQKTNKLKYRVPAHSVKPRSFRWWSGGSIAASLPADGSSSARGAAL